MNKFIEKQLKQCKRAQIPEFDSNTTHIFIPKGNIKKDLTFETHKYYFIEIKDEVVNPQEGNSLSSNWNNGTHPPHKYMNVEVIMIMGKMIKVCGVAVDSIENRLTLPVTWEGWIPNESMKILEELE